MARYKRFLPIEARLMPQSTSGPKPYIRLTMQGTKLVASNWIGVAYVVDLTTGNVDAGKSEGRPW